LGDYDLKVERYGVSIDLSYEHKTGCPKCISQGRDKKGENLHVYGLGDNKRHLGAFCFSSSCGYTIPSEDWLEENRPIKIEDMEYELLSTEFNKEVHDGIKSITTFNSKGYRGISTETSKYFGVRYECSQETGDVVASYYPVTKGVTEGIPVGDAITGYKIRQHPKSFRAVGEVGKESDLFGMFRFQSHKGILVICGGEVDQLSMYQVLKEDYDKRGNTKYDEVAVVSPTTGEGSISQIKYHYNYFKNFNKIIIAYDNDEAGRIATEATAQVLPRGKVFVMPLRNKDINEYIQKGMEKQLISDFWSAKPWTPDGVKSSFDGFYDIESELLRERITLPPYMHKLQYNMGGGFVQGATHNIIAATGVSKTTHVRHMVYHMIMNSGLKPTIISLEETAVKYNLELLQLHAKENFMFGKTGQEIIDYLKTPRMAKLQQELIMDENGQPRYYILDERSGNIKSIEDLIEMLHKKHGSEIFICDVLSDLLRGSSADLAEDHMAFQRRMNKEGVTFFNTHHTRKPSADKDGKERKTTEYDVLGTGSFVQSGHTNIVLNRDKLAQNGIERNTTQVSMPKCRGGITGEVTGWFWDFNTLQCYDVEDYKKDNPHLFVGESNNE
jgi:hypothetical protein